MNVPQGYKRGVSGSSAAGPVTLSPRQFLHAAADMEHSTARFPMRTLVGKALSTLTGHYCEVR